MNTIAFPLKLRMDGANVANLQAALRLFLDRGIILGDDDAARRDAVLALKAEQVESTFGEATRNCVARLQIARQLQVAERGAVDEVTANAMNAILREFGMLDATNGTAAPQRPLVVSGQVRGEDHMPFKGGLVRAFHDTAEGATIRLGEDTTDAEGRYTIRYDDVPDFRNNLRVSISAGNGKPLSTRIVADAKPLEIVDLTAPLNGEPAAHRVVEGRITLEYGAPAARLKLRLYRSGFGGAEALLAEGATQDDGRYALNYDSGGQPASLEIRAVDAAGAEVPLSRTLYDTGDDDKMIVDLVAPAAMQPLAPEFKRMTGDLLPHVGDIARLALAQENEKRQDLTLLNRASGWDARLIALASHAASLAADPAVNMPHEALYGLLRMGMPSDKLQLARMDAGDVGAALKAASDAGIVSLGAPQIADATAKFTTFARQARLALPAPGSRSTYADLLKGSGVGGAASDKFASVFLANKGGADALWSAAADAGISPGDIDTLQRQGKLAFLTRNSDALTSHLQRSIGDQGPAALVDKGLYTTEAWKQEIRAAAGNDEQKIDAMIPEAYAAETPADRLEAYAQDMARKVRRSYPTDVVRHMVETDGAGQLGLGAARAETAALLKKVSSQGFRLGQTPVDAFIKASPEVAAGASEASKQGLKTLQRVFQITPSNDAMSVLLGLGLTSAYDVVAYSREDFMNRFGGRFANPGEAELVYRKAQQVTSVTYNLFTVAKALDSMVPIHGTSGPPQQHEAAKQELKDALKNYPTMESLFGSMDYCECEHCRSVLSPAAYLVDLLQFIDADKKEWDSFLADWSNKHGGDDYLAKYRKPIDALFERRPDLRYIPLTCENTNTALPYIDIVNEILEYYVANDALDGNAAHDTGETPSADLLAEPQHVIAKAYEKLLQARYPMMLPFDRSIETVRRFCDYFETPLAQVMEALRPGDVLFAPAQRHDRAAIFMESLGLSPAEYPIFTDPDPLPKWHELFGYASDAEARAIATDPQTGQRTDLNSAKALSRRLDVTYQELVDIVRTSFVNPQLGQLVMLYKLDMTVADVLAYRDDKALLLQDPATLGVEDRKRFDEAKAFEARLDALSASHAPFDAKAWLTTALGNGTFNDVLVLDDRDSGCNFDLTTIAYAFRAGQAQRAADPIAFLRINLFVRLWRKLGWTIEETDRALQAFVPKDLLYTVANLAASPLRTALLHLAHLKELDRGVRVGKNSRVRLLTLWSDLPTTGRKPLYAQLFLTPGALRTDAVFDDPLGQYLSPAGVAAMAQARRHEAQLAVAPAQKIDPAAFAAHPRVSASYDSIAQVQHLSFEGVLGDGDKAALAALSPSPALAPLLDAVQARGREFSLVKGHILALQGAIGLTADDIERILVDDGKSLGDAALSLPNVSLLYRYALLARALRMPVRDMIALKSLSGLDAFRKLPAGAVANLEDDYPFSQTLRFIEVAGQVKDSGLKVADLEYLLRHHVDDNVGKYRPHGDATRALASAMALRVRAIRAENAVPPVAAEVAEDALRQKLSLVLAPEVVERLVAMINGTAEFTVAKTGVAPADKLTAAMFAAEPAVRAVTYVEVPRREQKLTFRGVLLPARRDALKAASPNAVFGDLLDGVASEARSYFDDHLLKRTVGGDAGTGFLDAADFGGLFAPLKTLAAIAPGDTQAQIDQKLADNEQSARDNAEELRRRRNRASAALSPLLQQRLIRQYVVETMTSRTGAEPALVESLVTDERLLTAPGEAGAASSVLSVLAGAAAAGIDGTFFESSDGSGAAQATPRAIGSADTSLRPAVDIHGNVLNTSNSARFQGDLMVPTPGAYRFLASFDKQAAEGELRFDHVPRALFCTGAAAADGGETGNKPDEYLELKPGTPYRFALKLDKLVGGNARLLVQGETLPKAGMAQLELFSADAVDRAVRTMDLLDKALQLVQALGLTEREMRYVLTHAADFDNVSLSSLPTRESDDTPAGARALFAQFLRIAAYAATKRDVTGGGEELIDVLEAAAADQPAMIARLTRRDEATVKATANALFAAPDFRSEIPVRRLWGALQVVERFGIPVASLVAWTGIASASAESRFAIARDAKEAIKARFEPETWRAVAQPIFDRLRRSQRDALVGYVMHQHGFTRLEQLYEYFLADPGMEPVVQTSRIRLALGSVQLFIQRCLLNLERRVPPAVVNARQWEWVKRYRVWEANRKIFLFPENWLEPEFRDDKTHLYSELEGSLLQGDVSNDLVEDAFLKYLRKLEMLARLDIVAMHIEDHADPAMNTLHVFGRTHGQPQYFHRRYANQMWTPWEPVDAQLEGVHLAPVAWRDRLYLFWVTFMDTASQPAMPGAATGGKKMADVTLTEMATELGASVSRTWVEVSLHWAEYLKGAWLTRESSTATLRKSVTSPFDPKSVFVHVSKEPYEAGEERGIYIHLGGEINAAFYMAGRNSAPEPAARETAPLMLYSHEAASANRYVAKGPMSVTLRRRIVTELGKRPIETIETPAILQQGDTRNGYSLLACDNAVTTIPAEIAALTEPLFYQDNVNTFFVEPTAEERTIEEWRDWVTHTPSPDPLPGPFERDWGKYVDVRPGIPQKKGPPIDPRAPYERIPDGPDSLVHLQPGRDWLVNTTTGLLFDGSVVGPAGHAGLTVMGVGEAQAARPGGAMPVNIGAGGALASNTTVVATGAAGRVAGALDTSVGLNIIGGGGLNATLANNLSAMNRFGSAPMR
jgi:hypothetical protein